ncbi:MAG TPA: efflux RND transporter periplasmic adaptor subunit [Candidatus Baltobacteraceae bacterium]|nr:efflux RND transporter periplasmic adaptor subunit [Candidatus Baltobacteraceae bacterium]
MMQAAHSEPADLMCLAGRRNTISRTAFCVVYAVSAVLLGCSSKEPREAEPVVSVQTAIASRKTIQEKIAADAILYPRDEAAIVPKVSAPIEKFYVQRGSHVHTGQLLATIENKDLAAALTENQGGYQQAQAAYDSARQSSAQDLKLAKQQLDAAQQLFDGREALYRQGAIAEKDVEDARVALTQARNQYDLAEKQYNLTAAGGELTSARGKLAGAQAQLGYTRIVSPIDGVVTDCPFYPGETPPSGAPIVTVMDLSSVVARAHLSQAQATELRVGDVATVSIDGQTEMPGKVVVVSPALDPNSTTVQVWIQTLNPGGVLKPGSTAAISVVARNVKDALVVPAEAILSAPDGTTSVMVVGSDGIAHQTSVATGIHDGAEVQIVSGLHPGEQVVTQGAYGLPDGAKVAVSNSPAQAATASGH